MSLVFAGCLYEGKRYGDGEKVMSKDDCESCHCTRGRTFIENITSFLN